MSGPENTFCRSMYFIASHNTEDHRAKNRKFKYSQGRDYISCTLWLHCRIPTTKVFEFKNIIRWDIEPHASNCKLIPDYHISRENVGRRDYPISTYCRVLVFSSQVFCGQRLCTEIETSSLEILFFLTQSYLSIQAVWPLSTNTSREAYFL